MACAVERGRVFCLTPIPAGDPKPVRDVAPWMRQHCPATGIQDPVTWYGRHPAGSDGGRASRNQPTAGRGALCPCRGMHSCRGGSCGRSGSQYTRNAFAFRMRRSSYHYMRRNAFELFYLLRTRIAKTKLYPCVRVHHTVLYHIELMMAGWILLSAMAAGSIWLYIKRRRERLEQGAAEGDGDESGAYTA